MIQWFKSIFKRHGRLYNNRVYLIGAIDRCPNRGAEWRKGLEKRLTQEFGCNVYNPLDKPIDIGSESQEHFDYIRELKAEGDYAKLASLVKQIRCVDLRMCDKADFAICYINMDIHLCGTYEELSWLNRSKKPVLIFCEQGKSAIPTWLFGMLPHEMLFDNIEDLIAYLRKVHDGTDTRTFDRWMFFKR